MSTCRLFISYSRKDRDIVARITELLRAGGILAFRDEDSIPPGKPWKVVLSQHLRSCERVMVFWSANAATSEAVHNEYTEAVQMQKDLVPVLLDDTPLSRVLAQYQWIDFRPFVLVRREKLQTSEGGRPSPPAKGLFGRALTWLLGGAIGSNFPGIHGAIFIPGLGDRHVEETGDTPKTFEDVVVLELRDGVQEMMYARFSDRMFRGS